MVQYALALDVGGTFTDVVLMQRDSGQLWVVKTPSTPADPSVGFFQGVQKILPLADVAPAAVRHVFHGSTVATNAILEGKGAHIGMLTTEGFQAVLEIGRHDIPRRANLYAWVKPARPVPPRRILEVRERVLLDGTIAIPLDEAHCRTMARQLRAMGVEAVAVVLLYSYANPSHEQRVAAILHEEMPPAQVSLSSQVLPVFREYERAMATVLNAYVQPLVSRYVSKLASGLQDSGVSAPLLIMKSNGGVFSPLAASRQAVHMALSGPAAGAIGASYISHLAGYPNTISIDVGGTSADICLIQDGRPAVTHEGEIGAFPLQIPMTDIHTIGAGGGSIATVTSLGSLTVGPQSAGAAPGPACYGKGGEAPTVTDANLLLGRIPPYLLGGEVPLDVERARLAIQEYVATPLGLEVYEAAAGMVQIINNNMMGALRVVSVEKGYDPQRFALVAFGGAGPLHAGQLAALLGMPTVIIPPHPGLLSALGLLATDVQYDAMRTCVQRAPHYDLQGMEAVYQELEQDARAYLTAEGIAPAQQSLQRLADLRYARQGFEVTVELPPAPDVTTRAVDTLVQHFHQRHEQLYTYAALDTPVEIVNLRLRAVGHMAKLALPRLAEAPPGSRPEAVRTRPVYFRDRGFIDTPIVARHTLLAGHSLRGPAIIEQVDTTTVLFPGHVATVDAYGNIIMHLNRSGRL